MPGLEEDDEEEGGFPPSALEMPGMPGRRQAPKRADLRALKNKRKAERRARKMNRKRKK
jgi:hypothetical protein